MVRSLPTSFSGLCRQSAQTETFLGRYGFLCPTMATFPYAGPSGVLSPSSIVLPLKTGDVDRPGLGGLASWWLHCLAPRSPLTAYCVARAHADGLTAPSLAYPILHGATLEGGRADGGVRAIRLGRRRLSLAQPFFLQ